MGERDIERAKKCVCEREIEREKCVCVVPEGGGEREKRGGESE